jgi:hypothetical protein
MLEAKIVKCPGQVLKLWNSDGLGQNCEILVSSVCEGAKIVCVFQITGAKIEKLT